MAHFAHLIVVNRLRAYVQRRTAAGKAKEEEIIRCLKRAVAREIYTALKADLAPNDTESGISRAKDQQPAA